MAAAAKQEQLLIFKGVLGSGRFGSVHLLVADASSKIRVARKYFYNQQHAEREIKRWNSVKGSAHIIEMCSNGFNVPSLPVTDCNGAEYRHELQYIDFPFMMYGSLAGILDTRYHSVCYEKFPYDGEVAFSWVVCLLHALHFLHTQCKIAHCDLKPANILIGNDGLAKLCDLGSVSPFQTPVIQKEIVLPGTLTYMPPETVLSGEISAQLDIWSLGIIMFELAAKHVPWKMFRIALTEEIKRKLIIKGELPNVEKWEGFTPSREYRAILIACCNPEKTLRPLASQLLQLASIRNWQPKANPQQLSFYPLPPIDSKLNSEHVKELTERLAVSLGELDSERCKNKHLSIALANIKQEFFDANTIIKSQTQQLSLQSQRILCLEKADNKLQKAKRAMRRFTASSVPSKHPPELLASAEDVGGSNINYSEPPTVEVLSRPYTEINNSAYESARIQENAVDQEGLEDDEAAASTSADDTVVKRKRNDVYNTASRPIDLKGVTTEPEFHVTSTTEAATNVPKSRNRKSIRAPRAQEDLEMFQLSDEQQRSNLWLVSDVFQKTKRLIAEKAGRIEGLTLREAEALQELVAFNVKQGDMGDAFKRQLSLNATKMHHHLSRCGSTKLTRKWGARDNYYAFLVFLFCYELIEKRVVHPIEALARIDLQCRSVRSILHKKGELVKKLNDVLHSAIKDD